MKSIYFDQCNRSVERVMTYKKDKRNEVAHYYFNGKSTVRCYHGTFWERFKFLITGNVWLVSRGSMPHISDISVTNPFKMDIQTPKQKLPKFRLPGSGIIDKKIWSRLNLLKNKEL